jgi:ribosomal protein L37AE/L43A
MPRYMQKIKQKIAKNLECPNCHKKIAFGRKLWTHGYIWNDEPCPHCNQTIKVVGLG